MPFDMTERMIWRSLLSQTPLNTPQQRLQTLRKWLAWLGEKPKPNALPKLVNTRPLTPLTKERNRMGRTKNPERAPLIKWDEPLYFLNAKGDSKAQYVPTVEHPKGDTRFKFGVLCGEHMLMRFVDEKGFLINSADQMVRVIRNLNEAAPPAKTQTNTSNNLMMQIKRERERITALEVVVRDLCIQLGYAAPAKEEPRAQGGSSTPVVLRRFGEGPIQPFTAGGSR